ncbi:MAG: phosphatidate cytidylyltransferase [Nitrospirales bacterium]|nr:phosphatidate cytidylyltransferase [Nitrospira sp.]MDR4459494.1 phosphatidate cytidylyltransferase [Nitrospirales bacterium]MDR4484549.1 phosphatidate cytidylyltransferase [Nitrospirales bacterium]
MDPRRLYSAIVFIPLLYGAIRYSPPWLLSLLIGTASLFALWEFLTLYFGPTGTLVTKVTSSLSAVMLLVAMYTGYSQALNLWLLGIIMVILTGFFISPMAMRQRLPLWVAYPFGILYVVVLLGHFILLRQLPHGIALIFFVLVITWLADTGGFIVGLSFGRHALAPTLSPKKTIEGLIGGVLFSLLGAIISHFWFLPFFSLGECAILGIGMAIIGALGDLAESAIKRSVSIKDSGTIIPGHGGVLDRVDSLLFTGPGFYYYALFTGSTS